MIYLLIFISLIVGLYLRYHLIIGIILAIGLLVITYLRGRKWIHLVISLSCLGIGVGMSYISFSYAQTSYDAVVIDVKDNYYLVSSKLERLYVYEKDNQKEIGDIIHLEGKKKELSFYKIENGFDFTDYLNKKGVRYEFEVNKETKVFSNPLRFKQYQDKFLSHFSSDTRGMVGSILFGRNEEYNGKYNLDGLHINRLINASGIYYGIYLSFFTFLFSFLLKKKWAKLLGLTLLVPYLLSMIGRFSLWRFFIFAVFRYFNEYVFKEKVPFIKYYCLIGIGFLLFDFHLVYIDSFILGFAIPLLTQLVNRSFDIGYFIRKKLIVCVVILLFFIPFDIKYHHELFIFSYPMQVVMTPLFVVFGVTGIFSSYGLPIYPVLELLGKIIINISSFLIKSKVAIHVPTMNEYMCLLYYVIFYLFLYYMSIRFKLIYKYLSGIAVIFSFIYLSPVTNLISDRVTFINVGQGDACLIRHGISTVLIDTGGSIYQDIAKECLIPYFKSQRIYSIDLLITTHNDYDHMGAASSLMENFTVRNYITDYQKFPIEYKGMKFTNYNTYSSLWNEDNDASLVIGFSLGGLDYLIMGDAPISIEKEMIKTYQKIPCDILKAGHHGSNTSSCDEFIKFVSPQEAILSVGRNNYGHPSKKVVKILEDNKVRIRSTLKEGSISYTSYSFAL